MQEGKEFDIMLSFIKGDARFREQFRYLFSIRSKLGIIDLFYKHVVDQIPRVEKRYEEVREKGYSNGKESLLLLGYYEAYLNGIYSFLENISKLTLPFFPRKNLPHSFHDQKRRFIEVSDLDQEYSTFLKAMTWYDEIHSIRSESTHFLSGLITANQNTPGYWNEPLSKRKESHSKINIEDIKQHVGLIQQNVVNFVDTYGKLFIKKIDQDKEVIQVCVFKNGLLGTRWISLKQFVKGHPGRCHTIKFDCPEATTCKARKNALKNDKRYKK